MEYINKEKLKDRLLRYHPDFEKTIEEIDEFPSVSESHFRYVSADRPPNDSYRVQVELSNGWVITAYYDKGKWYPIPHNRFNDPIGEGEYKYICVLRWRDIPGNPIGVYE